METETSARRTEILQNKIENLIANKKGRNQYVLDKIERDNELLSDHIVPLGQNSPLWFYSNGSIKMSLTDPDEASFDDLMKIHPHALNQLAEKFDVPAKYMRYLSESEWGRDLAVDILSKHKNNIPRGRILVRSVGNETRAILSDKYRRLNSNELYKSFITGSKASGAVVYDAFYSQTKSYINTIIPRVYTIDTPNNGIVHSVFGAKIRNSDYGDGALLVSGTQLNVVCDNGLVTESLLRQVHLGKRLPDNINFSNKTYRLDTEAMASAIDDIMREVLSEDRIIQTATTIKEASAKIIDVKKEVVKLNKLGITKDETSMIETKLLANNPEDGVVGQPTMWKLSQAITSVANDIGEERKHELDMLAGKLINL